MSDPGVGASIDEVACRPSVAPWSTGHEWRPGIVSHRVPDWSGSREIDTRALNGDVLSRPMLGGFPQCADAERRDKACQQNAGEADHYGCQAGGQTHGHQVAISDCQPCDESEYAASPIDHRSSNPTSMPSVSWTPTRPVRIGQTMRASSQPATRNRRLNSAERVKASHLHRWTFQLHDRSDCVSRDGAARYRMQPNIQTAMPRPDRAVRHTCRRYVALAVFRLQPACRQRWAGTTRGPSPVVRSAGR